MGALGGGQVAQGDAEAVDLVAVQEVAVNVGCVGGGQLKGEGGQGGDGASGRDHGGIPAHELSGELVGTKFVLNGGANLGLFAGGDGVTGDKALGEDDGSDVEAGEFGGGFALFREDDLGGGSADVDDNHTLEGGESALGRLEAKEGLFLTRDNEDLVGVQVLGEEVGGFVAVDGAAEGGGAGGEDFLDIEGAGAVHEEAQGVSRALYGLFGYFTRRFKPLR